MTRSRALLWLSGLVGLLSLQCLESLSDDCTKTLTCGDAPRVQTDDDCRWRFPDGGIWEGGPQPNDAGQWLWPDGTPSEPHVCGQWRDPNLLPDAGGPPCPATPCDEPLECQVSTGRCVECTNDGHCSGGEVCDSVRGQCVECASDENCTGDEATRCRLQDNVCVECLNDSTCTDASAPRCNVAAGVCAAQCRNDNDCTEGDAGFCNTQLSVCVQCLSDAACAGTATPQCNLTTNRCVTCTDASVCPSAAPACDTAKNACVLCVEDAQCPSPDANRCDTADNVCVACLNDAQCTLPTAARCSLATHTCVGCNDNSQCVPGAPLCDVPNGRCVSCLSNDECGGDTPVCNPTTGSCVGCLNDAQCTDPAAARCNLEQNVCAGCQLNAECSTAIGGGPLCREGDGLCVNCLGNADCLDDPAASRCGPGGECTSCEANDDCDLFGGLPACAVGANPPRCVECIGNADCAGSPNGPVCDTANNVCVECVANPDCTDPQASRCVQNQCQPCAENPDCNGIVNGPTALGVCDAGECVQCTGTQFGPCAVGGAQRVCNSTLRTCTGFAPASADACDECVSDAHCSQNQLCVPQTFQSQPLGTHCLPRQSGSCNTRPFLAADTTVSVDSVGATVCGLAATTCAAFNDFVAAAPCNSDANCGASGVDDGVCELLGGTVCSVPCGGVTINCPPGGTCSPSGNFCE